MANYMAEIAKLLGVELGEEFECSNGSSYVFEENGLSSVNTPYATSSYLTVIFYALCNGSLTIKQKSWKPRFEERYWSIGPGGVLEPGTWLNDFIDVAMYRLGNCYQTSREAEVNREKWISFYASDEVLEV